MTGFMHEKEFMHEARHGSSLPFAITAAASRSPSRSQDTSHTGSR